MELRQILEEQTTAFKINLSYGFILQHHQSRRLKYYHSSCNCCGRFLEKPCLVKNAVSFDAFLESIHEQDVLKWAINQRPNSDWVCVMVTNATFFVNRILQHPIGCVGIYSVGPCVISCQMFVKSEFSLDSALVSDSD